MVKKGRKAPLVERVKSILIVLLSLSAIYLALRVQLPGVLNGLISKPETIGGGAQTTVEERTAIAHPLHMAVMVQGGSESQRYGVQYDQADGNALFQQLYGLLVEALSSTSQPVQVEEELWKNALSTAPGVYFDWQGVLPFSVLNGWLSVDNSRLTGSVRHLVLTTAGEQVTLYYRNEADGLYYTCTSDVVSSSRLREAVGAMKGNEAVFAFEDETYQKLSPYTMLLKHPPSPAIYTVSNPLMEREGFEKLLDELGFPKDSSYYYNALGEQVIRHENDTLRISDSGVVTYDADEDRQRFPVPEDLYGMVESCRQLAQETLGSLGGEAQFYLMSANELDQGVFQVEFGYRLNDVQVRLGEEGAAARFWIGQGRIQGFYIHFRRYEQSGTTSVVMPEQQAAAAMEAMGHGGEELMLVYPDGGGDLVSAAWASAGELRSGG